MLQKDSTHQIKVVEIRFSTAETWMCATCPEQLWELMVIHDGETKPEVMVEYLSEQELIALRGYVLRKDIVPEVQRG